MGIHGKIGGAIESIFLETSCWKHTATFVTGRLSPQAPGLASLIAGGFALVPLPWCPAKHLLTQNIDAYKCACKSILLNASSHTLLINISVFALLVSRGSGWCGWRCGAEALPGGREGSPHQSTLVHRRLRGARGAACESQGCSCDSLAMKLNYPQRSNLSKRLWWLQKWDDYNGHSARSQG